MLEGDPSLAWTPPEKTYVAILDDGRIAGFCSVGACGDAAFSAGCESMMLAAT